MKSISQKIEPFSMEDFEKGLMLAGYISPSSISELNERNQLEEYEKQLAKEKSNLFFKRAVLAAEIAHQLYEEPTFGRVKFQKLVYLCEHFANMNLEKRYVKQAAGPFDNKFMHSIDTQFVKNKWFKTEKVTRNSITRYFYKPLESVDNYKKYYQSYFSENDTTIQNIIELFRKENTDTCEIAATIYACLVELSTKNIFVSESSLHQIFYNWSDAKKRFSTDQINSVWSLMIGNGIIPTN